MARVTVAVEEMEKGEINHLNKQYCIFAKIEFAKIICGDIQSGRNDECKLGAFFFVWI